MRKRVRMVVSLPLVLGGVLGISAQAIPMQVPAEHKVSDDVPPLLFDVASIRETELTPPPRQYLHNPNRMGSFDAVLRLNQLVGEAFGVNFRYQLAGGPDWFYQQMFTVHARADTSVDHRLASLTEEQSKEEKRRMLLRLLEQRFDLTYHIEQRPALTYFLTFQRETVNFRPAPEPSNVSDIVSSGQPNDVELTGRNAKMSQFVGLMSYYLKAPVLDQTGLKGTYNFKVHFNARPDLQDDDSNPGPLPEQALIEQMGLRLVRGKAPVLTIVIDSVKKPSPN